MTPKALAQHEAQAKDLHAGRTPRPMVEGMHSLRVPLGLQANLLLWLKSALNGFNFGIPPAGGLVLVKHSFLR
jgi:hypothetical protein